MTTQPTLNTERLLLRPIKSQDIPRVVEIAGSKDVYDMTLNIPHPYDEAMAVEWISQHEPVFRNKGGACFGIALKENNLLIGAISAIGNSNPHKAEIGYWICKDHRQKGYCTEALKCLIDYAFKELAYHKLSAQYMEGNQASGRVIEKAGLSYEGKLIDEICKDGQYRTMITYGIINPNKG